jgi:hypothetical protein
MLSSQPERPLGELPGMNFATEPGAPKGAALGAPAEEEQEAFKGDWGISY